MATGRVPTTANSPLTAKGDLFGYSTTQARVAVGNDGETLVADSSTSTGLRYQGNFAAGKNKIINGDFNINQRGFTSNTGNGQFGFDRFYQTQGGSGTVTVTPQTFTPGTAPVSGYESANFVRYTTASGTTASTYALFNQKIEDVRTFAGQTVTVSFWAKAGSGTPKLAVEMEQSFGSGGSSSVTISAPSAFTISTSWARYSTTINIPSVSGKTIGAGSSLFWNLWVSAGSDFAARANSIGIQNNSFDIWGVQVEAGSVATAFQTATGTIQGELAACKYYFRRYGGNANFEGFGVGQVTGSTGGSLFIPFETGMRTTPVGTYATASNFAVHNSSGSGVALTSISTDVLTKMGANLSFAVASGLTAGNAGYVRANNTTSSTIDFNAEL